MKNKIPCILHNSEVEMSIQYIFFYVFISSMLYIGGYGMRIEQTSFKH